MENILIERQVSCSAMKAWDMFTQAHLLSTFLGEANHIELEVGGAYEIYFSMKAPEGERGSEKCTILKMEPGKNLSFTWSAPPSIPFARNSGLFTIVSIDFISNGTKSSRIRLNHSGWNFPGEHWLETKEYFTKAWPYVLDQLVLAINQK